MSKRRDKSLFPEKPSEACLRYMDLLVQLHALIAEGRDDGEEGEIIRSWMDEPWHLLTNPEKQLVDELSAQLYDLHGAGRRRPLPDGKWMGEAAAMGRWNSRDWKSLLSSYPAILANRPQVPREYLLGKIWEWSGVPRAALQFYEAGWHNREPHSTSCYMVSLFEAGRLAEATVVANHVVNTESFDPEDKFFALIVRCQEILGSTNGQNRQFSLSRLCNRLLEAYKDFDQKSVLFVDAGLQLVLLLNHVGRHQEAKVLLDKVPQPSTTTPQYRTALGLHFLITQDFNGALSCFSQLKQDPTGSWAWVWLAVCSMMLGDYESAREWIAKCRVAPMPSAINSLCQKIEAELATIDPVNSGSGHASMGGPVEVMEFIRTSTQFYLRPLAA